MKTITINGKTYVEVKKEKVVTPKISPYVRFTEYMKKRGDKLISEVNETYKRKDGKLIPVTKLSYNNNRTYMVSDKTFWIVR